MVTRIPARPRLSKTYHGICGDYCLYRPCFEYFIDPDAEGYVDGKHYHGIVVAKMYCIEDLYREPVFPDGISLLALTHGLYGEAYEFARYIIGNNNPAIAWLEDESEKAKLKEQFDCSDYKAVFSAKAYCFDDDEWNEETGKRIARQKCWLKYRYTFDTFLDKLFGDLLDVKDKVCDIASENGDIIDSIEEDLFD